MRRETIKISPMNLEWSDWFAWDSLKADARRKGGIRVPNVIPGVYEVRYQGQQERLTIGRTSNLRMRVKDALVKGKIGHPAGTKIRAKEDTSKIVVRWAVTDRPACVEEELHRRHMKRFRKRPKHTGHT